MFQVGDLVTYKEYRGAINTPMGIVTEVNTDSTVDYSHGHVVVYWFRHSSFQGKTKAIHPASIKKINKKLDNSNQT